MGGQFLTNGLPGLDSVVEEMMDVDMSGLDMLR